MSKRGDSETGKLKANIESQLNRLLTQLQDLKDMKDDMDEEEYNTSRQETIDQMEEFEISLQKMASGDMTLVDDVGSIQLAIQAAIRGAFKSPDTKKIFVDKESTSLRKRLKAVEEDYKLGRINKSSYDNQCRDIIASLQKLGETLSPHELHTLTQKSRDFTGFVDADDDADLSMDSRAKGK